MKDLNIRPETLKLVQEIAGYIMKTMGLGKGFLSRTQVAQQLREKIDKWDYMKLKSSAQ
jgi:CTP-dependent riboflavin kinase